VSRTTTRQSLRRMALITRLAFFSFTVVCVSELHGQELGSGARAAALAQSDFAVAAAPFEAVNPAAVGNVDHLSAAFSAEQAYGMPELRYAAASLVLPQDPMRFGLAAESFGFSDYRRSTASVVLAARVAHEMHVGARGTYRHVGVLGYPGNSASGLSLGWLANVHERAVIGGAWRYLAVSTRAVQSLLTQEVVFGAGLQPADGLRVFVSVTQEVGTAPDFRLGSEIVVSPNLSARVGTGTNPTRVGFGIGIQVGSIGTDLGVVLHPILGPSLSTTVRIR